MKKVNITVAVILAAITIFFVGCTAKKYKVPVIGISQYGEHASLDNCREGFLLGLKEAGLTEGEDYTIEMCIRDRLPLVETKSSSIFEASL